MGVEPSGMGLVPLEKRPQREPFPSIVPLPSHEDTTRSLYLEELTSANHAGALILNLTASRTVRNKYLLFISH